MLRAALRCAGPLIFCFFRFLITALVGRAYVLTCDDCWTTVFENYTLLPVITCISPHRGTYSTLPRHALGFHVGFVYYLLEYLRLCSFPWLKERNPLGTYPGTPRTPQHPE